MFRKFITSRAMIPVVLCLQVVPLVIFPLSTFTLTTQEWWLPAFLCLLMVISLVQILSRRAIAAWPWYLLSFAQGLNIISRMMMLFPHATITESGGARVANGPYIIIAFAAMLLSAFEIWYCELPEVRQKLAPGRGPAKAHA
jgi:hypothetical protein